MALDEDQIKDELVAQMEDISSDFNALSAGDKDLFRNGLALAMARTIILLLEGGTGLSGTIDGADFAVSGTDSNGDTPDSIVVTIT